MAINPQWNQLASKEVPPAFCDRCGESIRHIFKLEEKTYGSECIHVVLEQGQMGKAVRQCERKLNPPSEDVFTQVDLHSLLVQLKKLKPGFTILFKDTGGKVIVHSVDWDKCKLEIEEWYCSESERPKFKKPTIAQFAWEMRWI